MRGLRGPIFAVPDVLIYLPGSRYQVTRCYQVMYLVLASPEKGLGSLNPITCWVCVVRVRVVL